jgi:hypothetical protein
VASRDRVDYLLKESGVPFSDDAIAVCLGRDQREEGSRVRIPKSE